jgi:hypothetical protein
MLLTGQQSKDVALQLSPTKEVDLGSIEALRAILVTQQKREVAYSEAQEIASSLIEFYQILAEEAPDEQTS